MSDFIAVVIFVALCAGITYMHKTAESTVKLCTGERGVFLLEPDVEDTITDYIDFSAMNCDTLHLTNGEISKLKSSLRRVKLN